MSTEIDPQRVEDLARKLRETKDPFTRIVMYNDPANGNMVERLLAMNALPVKCVHCSTSFESDTGYEMHLGECPGREVAS